MLLSGAGESSRNRSRSWTGSTTLPGGRMYVHVGSIWRKDITSHKREDGVVSTLYVQIVWLLLLPTAMSYAVVSPNPLHTVAAINFLPKSTSEQSINRLVHNM